MMPGMNPRQMKKAMKRLGMSSKELDVESVTISLENGDSIKINSPQVMEMKMSGQKIFQVTGGQVESEEEAEEGVESEFSEEDIKMVAEQAGVSEEEAGAALEKEGDLAKAIMSLEE